VIVAILLFGSLWGFWGVFFAISLATHRHPRSDPRLAARARSRPGAAYQLTGGGS